MAKLGIKTIVSIQEQIGELLNAYAHELEVAYLKHGEDKFDVTLKASIEPKGTSNMIKTTISFKPEPNRTDSTDGLVDEDQYDIDFPEDEKE